MARLIWDQSGSRFYETGVKNGVLYVWNPSLQTPAYGTGVAWNGITAVTEKPTGADSNALYADNMKYLNLTAAEDFEATIEAYNHPNEFCVCDGSLEIITGVFIGQQSRRMFGLCYRTEIGSDTNDQLGYKLHLIWGAKVSPSEKAYESVNDSPDAINFSWDITTTPVTYTYTPAGGSAKTYTAASMTIDSRKFTGASVSKLTALENALYGTNSTNPTLPMPAEVLALIA